MVKKLVISYSDNDRDAALNLHQTLLNAGYEVWIAHEGLRGSVIWTQTILDAIENTDGIVLLWSSNTKKSGYVHEEIRIARVFLKPIFPLLARPMKRIPSLPIEARALQVIDEGDFAQNIAELMARLSDPEKCTIKYPEIPIPKKGHIPKPPNPHFVGRNSELKGLFVDTWGFQGETKQGIPIAVWGLAGIGKTHLALAFAYRFSLFFEDGVFWINTPNGIVQEFERIGSHLEIKRLKEEGQLDYAIRVYDRLCTLKKGLVIFDDVTNIPEFRKWCPVGNKSCSVILTTRKSPRGFAVRVMNLTELDANSALNLAISRRRDGDKLSADKEQRQALQKICDIMGNYPLALELCACRLQSEFVQPTEFLRDLESNPLEQLARQEQFQDFIDYGNANVLDLLARSYESLDREITDPYFLLMCWFPPHGMNTDLIRNAYGKPEEGTQALGELFENSLIYRDTEKTVSLHPLIAQFGRSLSKAQSIAFQRKFVEVIIEFLQKSTKGLTPEQIRAELPHVNDAIAVSREQGFWDLTIQLNSDWAPIVIGMDTRIGLLNEASKLLEKHLPDEKKRLRDICVQLGMAHKTKGLYKEALVDFERARKIDSEFPTVDPGIVTELQFQLGDVYLALGQYEEARKRLTGALDTALNMALYDAKTPQVTRIKQALARINFSLGNLKSAKEAFAEVLNQRQQFHAERRDAESSLAVSSSFADLSQLALERADYNEAIAKAEEALATAREYHGEDDPVCGNLYLLLGIIRNQSGDHRLAQELIEKAQQTFLPTFGDKHPSYAKTLVALAEVSRRLGKFGPALEKVKEAIKILEDRYGEAHPSVAEALEVQGKIYDHLCEFDKEEQVWNRILEIYSKAYSENHPVTATTHYNYANLYLRRGEFDKALEHVDKSLSITEKSLGKDNSNYFGRLILLAACYNDQQKYSQAEETLNEAQSLQQDVFGDSPHPYIARMYQLQSEVARRLGNFKKATEKIDLAISMKKEIYGEKHPSVAEALEIKTKVCHHLGDNAQAKLLIDQALKMRESSYGESHPEVGRSVHDLGSYYLRLGQYDNAIQQFEKSLKITESTYGKHHIEYIERALNLANALYEKGDYSPSLELMEELEDVIAETIVSENHYLKARRLLGMAELHRRLGRFKEALDYVRQAVKMRIEIYKSDKHPSVVEALECQGKIHDHLCEFDKEEEIWNKIIQSKVYPENHPSLATTYYDYGNLFLRKKDFNKAVEYLEKSLSITEKSLGKTHPEFFGRLIRLATCYYEQQKYSQAEEKLKDLQENTFVKSVHPYVARMHQLQSEVDRRLGKFDAALASIDQAIAMKEAIYDKDHPSIAEALEVKVKVFHHQGETTKAKELIERALKIRIGRYGESHPEVGRSEHDLGMYYLRLGQYEDAISHFEKAIKITETAFGKFHLEYIERTLHLTNALSEKGDYRAALRRVEEVSGIIDKTITSENHYLKARWLLGMAELYRRLGRFTEALNYVEQAVNMRIAIYGSDVHPSVAEALECQGKIYDHLGQFDKEEQVWIRTLDIQSKVYSENHPVSATTHYHYANLCLRKGESDQALKHLEKSLSITATSLGKNHSHYFGRLVLLATCYCEQQKYPQAGATLQDAQSLRKATFGESLHPYIARMYQLMSEIDRRLGRFDAGLTNIDQAISIKEAIYGKDHPSVAEALEIKVDLHLAQFQTEESKELLDRIESIRREAYGHDHPDFANYQLRLAEYLAIIDRYAEAQDTLKQSLQICQKRYASDHPEIIKRLVMSARLARISSDIATADNRINEASEALGERLQKERSLIVASVLIESSLIKRKQGDYTRSLAELEKAIEIETAILGAASPAVIESMVNRVKLSIVFHRLKEAQAILKGTLEMVSGESPAYKRLRADLLEQRGILETHRNECEKAVKTYDEAIALKQQVLNKTNAELSKLLVERAVALRTSRKYEAALDTLEEAQNLLNPLFNENHLYFARICLEIGRNHYMKRSYMAAKEQLEEALKIYEKQSQQDPREHAKTLEALGLVYFDTNFAPKASQLFGEALELKKSIYGQQHPEIAETLYYEARAFLKMKGSDESGKKRKESARQKLEQASQMLNGDEENSFELKDAIKKALQDF
ncbi:MAG: hypothetical protein ILNGONEN_00751 [Syntrophorhabdaceae bacterium]|nr:hypothetical protein [Syntrophorhabdaceae bacterium]